MRPFLLPTPSAQNHPKTEESGRTLILSAVLSKKTLSILQSCLSNMSKIDTPLSGAGVENNGFEPLTPCLQSRCSSQLS